MEERWEVISGVVWFWIDGREQTARAGEALIAAAGSPHKSQSIGQGPAHPASQNDASPSLGGIRPTVVLRRTRDAPTTKACPIHDYSQSCCGNFIESSRRPDDRVSSPRASGTVASSVFAVAPRRTFSPAHPKALPRG